MGMKVEPKGMNMKLEPQLNTKSKSELVSILSNLLDGYLQPAFGALPKREVDLSFLEALETLGVIPKNPTIYDLVTTLRVTRSKARTLYYDRELRRLDENNLQDLALETLRQPILHKNGDLFALEIDNPLVADHVRNMVRQVGYATDSSFSASLIKIPIDAYIALMDQHLSAGDKKKIKEALKKAGAPDGSFKGILKGCLKKFAEKAAGESGKIGIENASKYLAPFWEAAGDKITDMFSEFYGK